MMTRRARARIAGVAAAITFAVAAAGCGDQSTNGDDDGVTAGTSASPSAPPSQSPSPSASASQPEETTSTKTPDNKYARIAGTWRSTNGEWVLHLKANRTFVQDFAGVKDMREGKYKIKGKKFVLKGGDGLIDRGTYNGKKIRIRDFVFNRKK